MTRRIILIGACAVAAIAAYFVLKPAAEDPQKEASLTDGALVAIQVPSIEGNAAIGQRLFGGACQSCHGVNAVGIEGSGPPLVHKIYEPNHHADEAFQRAVANGVKSHHWPFGNMAPVDGLTRGDVAMIITYVRELQRANGIQ